MPAALDKALSGFKGEPAELIPVLQAVQKRLGYLPRQGKHNIKVCRGTACHIRGSARILRAIQKKLGIKPGETTPDYTFTLERVACFGACALSPVMMVNGRIHGNMTPAKALKLIRKLK